MFHLLTGTRVEDAKAILAASPLRMFASDDLDQAAKMVCLFSLTGKW